MANTTAAMNDLNKYLGVTPMEKKATQSTNKKAGSELDMTDFLTLMVAMFQNQDIDNAASTTDMMNQFVQMSVVQAVTNISKLIDDSTVLTYAASLVGKEVTIGEYVGNKLVETVGTVVGTGMLNGQQVVFLDNDKSYYLTDIMAVGRLPENKDDIEPGEGEDGDNVEGGDGVEGGGDVDPGDGETDPTDPENSGDPGNVTA